MSSSTELNGWHPVVKRKEGLYFASGNFYLDPQQPVAHAIITHAHSDHAVAGSSRVYCSRITAELMRLRFGVRAAGQFLTYEEGETFFINGVACQFYSSGHMAGSVMVMIDWYGKKVLFTGDWNHVSCGQLPPCRFPPADILITETTYARPDMHHPALEKEIQKIADCKLKVVAGAYRMGKAQRLCYLMSRFAPDIPVFIHRHILPVNRIYERHSISTGSWQPYSRQLFSRLSKALYIVPPHTLPSFSGRNDLATTFITGWKHRHFHCDFITHISDHADWNGLLYMIQQVAPQVVYTVHGKGTHLQTHFFASPTQIFEII